MSIVGTFAVMYLLGYSIDNLSLMALTLCRRLRRRRRHRHAREHRAPHGDGQEPRWRRRSNGAREIGFTIVSMTLSLAAVFIPVLFMGGIVGPAAARVRGGHRRRGAGVRLRLADADADAVQPLPAPARAERTGALYAASERVFDGMLQRLRRARCSWRCAIARFTLAVFVATLVATAYLFVIIPKGFIPNEDTGQVFAFTEAAQDISFDAMMEHQRAVADIVSAAAQRRATSCRRSAPSGSSVVAATPGASSCASSRATERPPADEIIAGPAAEARRHPGHQRLPADPADHPHRRPAHQEPVPVHAAGRRPRRSSTSWAPLLVRQAARRCPASSTSTRDLQITSPQVAGRDRPRQGLRPRRHRGADRERAQQRLRLAAGLDHLHADQPVLGDHGARCPSTSAIPPRCRCSTSARSSGKLVPLDAVAKLTPTWARSPSTTSASCPR